MVAAEEGYGAMVKLLLAEDRVSLDFYFGLGPEVETSTLTCLLVLHNPTCICRVTHS
jgi:hypothetical protein